VFFAILILDFHSVKYGKSTHITLFQNHYQKGYNIKAFKNHGILIKFTNIYISATGTESFSSSTELHYLEREENLEHSIQILRNFS
jgi:hypothetical protein